MATLSIELSQPSELLRFEDCLVQAASVAGDMIQIRTEITANGKSKFIETDCSSAMKVFAGFQIGGSNVA